jgi:hypothetical protein
MGLAVGVSGDGPENGLNWFQAGVPPSFTSERGGTMRGGGGTPDWRWGGIAVDGVDPVGRDGCGGGFPVFATDGDA